MPELRRRHPVVGEHLGQGMGVGDLPQQPQPEAVVLAPASLSGGKLGAAAATWALYREVEGLGRARAGWYLAQNLARAALKRAG